MIVNQIKYVPNNEFYFNTLPYYNNYIYITIIYITIRLNPIIIMINTQILIILFEEL